MYIYINTKSYLFINFYADVREVLFSSDVHLAEGFGGGLSLREYVAIGLCSFFLAVVYIASVFLYLHWRKQKQKKSSKKKEENAQLSLGEEGINFSENCFLTKKDHSIRVQKFLYDIPNH